MIIKIIKNVAIVMSTLLKMIFSRINGNLFILHPYHNYLVVEDFFL